MRNVSRNLVLVAACLFFYVLPCQADDPSLLQPIKDAILAKEYQKAYEYAQDLSSKYAGDSQFDYWYGKAAYESGHYSEASFALERVLIVEPGHQPAQHYLGLTYQKMGRK